MTDHEGNRENYLARGIQEGPKQLTIARGEAEGNSQLFPGPTESLMPEGSVIICFIISLYAFCDIYRN